MNTSDIIASLNMAAGSKRGIPNKLLLDIGEALHERDELRAALSAIVEAKRNFKDLSNALIQAAQLVDEFDEVNQ